jgi:ferredoxin-type protein NapF
MPVSFGKLTGFSSWFSPFLMLNSVLLLKSFVISNLIGFIIMGLAIYRRRWFCNNMCPVGFLQDIIAKFIPVRKQFRVSAIPVFSKWLMIISFGGALFGLPIFLLMDPVVIFNGSFVPLINPSELILLLASAILPLLLILHIVAPHLWCEKICPLGGLQLIIKNLTDFKKIGIKPKVVDEGRRIFIGGALGAATAIIFPGLTKSKLPSIRPPASIGNKSFNALCVRCGSCIKVCPSNILKHENRMGMGLMTPVIEFDNGYCLEDCNRCGSVCPSGAITKFSVGAKKDLKIARVALTSNTCLLMNFKECRICKSACHYDSINFEPYNGSSLQLKPVVNYDKCNGCGACSVICPVKCFRIEAL